jgi:hypothetical protein
MSSAVCTVLGKTRMAAIALSDVRNTVLSQRAVQCTAVYSSVEHAAELQSANAAVLTLLRTLRASRPFSLSPLTRLYCFFRLPAFSFNCALL